MSEPEAELSTLLPGYKTEDQPHLIQEAKDRSADDDENQVEKCCDDEGLMEKKEMKPQEPMLDMSKRAGESQILTATRDTLSPKETPSRSHVLSLERVYGRNPHLPVLGLQDHDQQVILYAGANVGIIYNHTLNTQHLLQGHCHLISSMCVTEDRRWIATADQGPQSTVIIWDSYSGIPVNTFFDCHTDGGVTAMKFSEDSKLLVTLGAEQIQRVCIWDWTNETQQPLWSTELNPAFGIQHCIIFNPRDSTHLVICGKTHGLFYTWVNEHLQYFTLNPRRFRKRNPVASSQPSESGVLSVSRCVFHWSKPQILATSGGNLVICDMMDDSIPNQSISNENVKVIQLQQHQITALTLTDRFLVIGNSQGQVLFYDENLRLLTIYDELNLDAIVSISFFKEGTEGFMDDCTSNAKPVIIRNFVVSTLSSTVVHVNAQNRLPQTLLQEEHEPINAVACHPNQPLVVIGNQIGILKVWNYDEKVIIGHKVFKNKKQIQCLAFDPQGLYLGLGFGSGAIHVLDPKTLQSNLGECFQCTEDSIYIITFSLDSNYLATADAGMAVTVFRFWSDKGSLPRWTCLGRYCSHYEPIKDLLFGVHLDSTQPRLLSLGMDRRLVDYDLENSDVNQLVISSGRIEQSAVPMCMAWYPPLTTEHFLLTVSDQYKMKLFNSTTKMCRKTLLGPTYDSPIEQILVLPKSTETDSYYLAFRTEDKVGLQILPVDGNPYKSNAVICHPTGASAFTCSNDGRFLFTTGRSDCTLMSWKFNANVLEAAAALGGDNLEPFLSLLDGGKNGKFYQEMEDFFFYCQIRHQGTDTMEEHKPSDKIPLSEVPALMRALAYFPTEQEIEDMQNEIKFSKYAETGKYVTDLDLGEFIKLYVNHRPAFGIYKKDLVRAFQVLGSCDIMGSPVFNRQELMELLQVRGEHMTEEEVSECFTTLLGLNDTNDEEGCSEHEKSSGSSVSKYSMASAIPNEISMEMFVGHILKLPSPPE